MRKFENGKYIDMTPEEIEALKAIIPEEHRETVEEKLERLDAYIETIKPFVEMLKQLFPASNTENENT